MFSSNFYSCPLLLLAVTNLGFGAEFCRRGIKGDEIKVFHIQFAMEQIFIISQNHAVLCRTDFGNVNRLPGRNTKPLSLTYRVANNSFMMPKHISVFICKIACRIVFSCKPADKSSIIPIWDKTDILAVRLICVIEILLVCDHAGLMFIHVSKWKHGVCQLLLSKRVKNITLVFCRVSCFFQKISAIFPLFNSGIVSGYYIVTA